MNELATKLDVVYELSVDDFGFQTSGPYDTSVLHRTCGTQVDCGVFIQIVNRVDAGAGAVSGCPAVDAPWRVMRSDFDRDAGRLTIELDSPRGSRFTCPSLGHYLWTGYVLP